MSTLLWDVPPVSSDIIPLSHCNEFTALLLAISLLYPAKVLYWNDSFSETTYMCVFHRELSDG